MSLEHVESSLSCSIGVVVVAVAVAVVVVVVDIVVVEQDGVASVVVLLYSKEIENMNT